MHCSWPLVRLLRLVILVVIPVVSVVVVTVAHRAGHFIQDQPHHIRPDAIERIQYRSDGFPVGPTRQGYHHHAVDGDGHLERLGESQKRRRIDDHQVVGRGFLQDLGQELADEFGAAA